MPRAAASAQSSTQSAQCACRSMWRSRSSTVPSDASGMPVMIFAAPRGSCPSIEAIPTRRAPAHGPGTCLQEWARHTAFLALLKSCHTPSVAASRPTDTDPLRSLFGAQTFTGGTFELSDTTSTILLDITSPEASLVAGCMPSVGIRQALTALVGATTRA